MHWLGNPVCPWSSQLRESKKFPRAAVPALLWSAHLQQTVWSFNAQTLLFVLPNVTFWWQNIKRIGLQCFALFSKKVFLCRGLKVSVKSRQSMFFVTVGLWVYPSPLSVAKLHPRMSYHRHICRKYAMKLCGSCTTGAICPPSHRCSLPSCSLLGLHVSRTALPSRRPLTSISLFFISMPASENWHLGTAVHDFKSHKDTDTIFAGGFLNKDRT